MHFKGGTPAKADGKRKKENDRKRVEIVTHENLSGMC